MDTNVIIAIVVVVVIAALLAIGGWWFGKSRKSAVDKSTEVAKAKADARLATEKSAAQSAVASAENAEKTKETTESAATEVESATSSATPESPVATEPTPVGSGVTESATPAVETPEAAGTRMQRLKARLSKSGNPFGKALFNILAKDQLSEADWEDVEDTLLLADVGAEASEQLVGELRNDARIAGQSDPAEVRAALKDKLLKLVGTDTDRRLNADKEGANKPSVIIMVGVNGTGKTTTAGKLSRLLVSEGKQVMLGAADTFRAAAADQLETWGAKVGVPVVRSDKDGADPASVAFEAGAKAKEENVDVLIIDTAGRLQNKANLMDELGKIRRVTEKNLPVDEVLLVLDATTGQNGMTQAKVFAEAIGITGVVLSKLDGSAKGGIVISVQKELGVPVKLVGLGEGPDDLAPFDPEGFVDGILA
ncbi:signal recognition particle-docking protein FtsY [Bifidobacterium adolescentis]|uniref:Signal recognition particle receptor FtsY n=1 Tax=Bifidobacterium adolescentis TaxID=1680 RepID=A0A7J5MX68_BIFAD|nr:signal recognition particle-docking protein FtsY [Bifidobacterium adolescentis]KAB5746665.1 signal recognition particle-docking protein FtsY [Bifidobacterium adolescentis]KAB5748499.1 signal recognition particle-docking protein FtsY [Bifidobacterium adolescentis]